MALGRTDLYSILFSVFTLVLVVLLKWQASISVYSFVGFTCYCNNVVLNIIISPSYRHSQKSGGEITHFTLCDKHTSSHLSKVDSTMFHLGLRLEGSKEVRVIFWILFPDLLELSPTVVVGFCLSRVSREISSASLRFSVRFRSVNRDTDTLSSLSFSSSSSCASMMVEYPWTTCPFLLTPDWKTHVKRFSGITSD